MININVSVKSITCAYKILVGKDSTCICENSRYLKIILDNSVIVCDKIIKVTDRVSTNMESTVSKNFDNNKDIKWIAIF